jgi:oxygen-independent coproporphyrinogen-3 oxidase
MLPSHVYVHIPFCARRCSYCDFAIAVRGTVPVDEYLRLLDREMAIRYPGGAGPVQTLYLGGGTPSRLGPDGIARLMAQLDDRLTLAPNAEVTIEANPDDVTLDAARVWRASGVNRVSLGAQSFDDRALAWMHRVHDAAAIPAACDAIRAAGFDALSLDLIFALPESIGRDWGKDLERALALDPTHVSLYGLTIEAPTPLGKWVASGRAIEAPEERYESEFLLADELLVGAGFEHYEVSNFGRPGHRARHNSAYWLGAPYAGLGPGAHEFAPPVRRWNVRDYAEWVRLLAADMDPAGGTEALTEENRIAEAVYLGLRTVDGLPIDDAEGEHVRKWVDAGWARVMKGGRLVLTPLGWLRLDSLAADLTLLRSR